MSLPEGAVFAPGELEKVVQAVAALKADPHAAHEISVNVVLHVHREYPKHVVIGKTEEGDPVTRIVNSEEEEAAAKAEAAGEPGAGSDDAGGGLVN